MSHVMLVLGYRLANPCFLFFFAFLHGMPKVKALNLLLLCCSYVFPSRDFPEKKNKYGVTKRKCSVSKLSPLKCLAYSKKLDGVFCAACRLFTVDPEHGLPPKLLSCEPFFDWKHLNVKVSNHIKTTYHQNAAVSLMSSLATLKEGGREGGFDFWIFLTEDEIFLFLSFSNSKKGTLNVS